MATSEPGGIVIELRPGTTAASMASVATEVKAEQDCSDEQGASVQYPNGEVCGIRWSRARDVLLIDLYVVGRLAQIPWLGGYGWRLTSVSGRPPVEAPSLPALVRAWLKQHGAVLAEQRHQHRR